MISFKYMNNLKQIVSKGVAKLASFPSVELQLYNTGFLNIRLSCLKLVASKTSPMVFRMQFI